MNMQPSEAEAGFDLRLPPTADPDLVKKRIAEEWAPAVRNMTYEVNHDGYFSSISEVLGGIFNSFIACFPFLSTRWRPFCYLNWWLT